MFNADWQTDTPLFKWADSPLSTVWSTERQDTGRTVDRIFDNLHRYAEGLTGSDVARDLRACDACGAPLVSTEEANGRYKMVARTTTFRRDPDFQARLDSRAITILHNLDCDDDSD